MMRIAVIYNQKQDLAKAVIQPFGQVAQEHYSQDTVSKVAKALRKSGHHVTVMNGDLEIIERLKVFHKEGIQDAETCFAFNMSFGIQGHCRYAHIPSILEMVGIPYTGSDPEAHITASDKALTKILLERYGIPTPAFYVLDKFKEIQSDMAFPLIVKPIMQAMSVGLHLVHNTDELHDAVEYIRENLHEPVLVEKYIPGREFGVALLGNGDPQVLPIVETDHEQEVHSIVTKDDKANHRRNILCPAVLTTTERSKIEQLAIRTFKDLNLADYARVDMRMDDESNIHVLEINSMANLSNTASYHRAALAAGYTFESLINQILNIAVERYFGEGSKVARN